MVSGQNNHFKWTGHFNDAPFPWGNVAPKNVIHQILLPEENCLEVLKEKIVGNLLAESIDLSDSDITEVSDRKLHLSKSTILQKISDDSD